jgi:hypothetical protein
MPIETPRRTLSIYDRENCDTKTDVAMTGAGRNGSGA